MPRLVTVSAVQTPNGMAGTPEEIRTLNVPVARWLARAGRKKESEEAWQEKRCVAA